MKLQKTLIIIAALLLAVGGIVSSGAFGLNWKFLDRVIKLPNTSNTITSDTTTENVRITSEESVVIDVVERVSPSVVTVGITATRRIGDIFEINPLDPFSPFRQREGRAQKIEQDIGSGFIVGSDGLIVTNKHVVSDPDAKYRVITSDDKTHDVVKIYRDPANDIAIIKIDQNGLQPVEMGNSDSIKVGQLAIAIGTALGEFRHTVTTGVISGVGRGIEAGGPFEGYVERLDNVIQTDAAINPGNSGGPLLNSSGQVVGINTAIAGNGENIGFAIPINVVKDALDNFNATGQFNRPFLGVQYRMITRELSVVNEVPEGAYVMDVVEGSAADRGGVEPEDIITKIDGSRVTTDNDLAQNISKKKVGDVMDLTIWRDGKERNVKVTLGTQNE